MKRSITLIMLTTAALLACDKSDEAAAPDTSVSEPTAQMPVDPAPPVTAPPAAEPVPPADPATPDSGAATTQPAPATPSTPTTAAAPPATAPDAKNAASKADLERGEQVYRQSCAVCHATGVAGAPKTGDKAAWAPRLARGMDALYTSAINGKGAMPAKGGNPSLSDADVKASVDYMAAQSR